MASVVPDVPSSSGQVPSGAAQLVNLADIEGAQNRYSLPLNMARSVLVQNRSNAALLVQLGYAGSELAPFSFIVDPVSDRGYVASEGTFDALTLSDMSLTPLPVLGSGGVIPRTSGAAGFIIISESTGRVGELIGAMSSSPTPSAAPAGAGGGGGVIQTGRVSSPPGANGAVTFPTPFSSVPTVYVGAVTPGTNDNEYVGPPYVNVGRLSVTLTGFLWQSDAVGALNADLIWAAIGS